MTWKSYAAVSGATVLAGWLASAPPSITPAGVRSGAQQDAPQPTAPSDIEQQAMRLQGRLSPERVFTEPERNPFRFGATERVTGPPPNVLAPPEPAPPPPPIEVAPSGPVVSLSGIAEDQVDGRVERTAILSSPAGVLLVREGEEILGYYRVARIEAEAVELVAIGDGATRRLTFGH